MKPMTSRNFACSGSESLVPFSLLFNPLSKPLFFEEVSIFPWDGFDQLSLKVL